MIERKSSYGLLVAPLLLAVACGDGESGAVGSVRVHATGEQAAKGGYPLQEGDVEVAFADGWTVKFEHVVASFSGFALQTADGEDADLDSGPVVVDLHRGDPELWSADDVPARRWDRVSFDYVPASDDARMANDVDPEILEAMIDGGYSLYVIATAEKGGEELALEYGFDFEIAHTRCLNGLDETNGLVVPAGAIVDAQITVHLDHLFLDTYATDGAVLRFDAMAAVAGDDGVITLEDLEQQDNLSDLLDADGSPLDLAYDSGSAFETAPSNLREYVTAAATTTGHLNGGGHCHYERLDD